ncbi:hypothetical protein D3C80_1958090 [compost metagenome]
MKNTVLHQRLENDARNRKPGQLRPLHLNFISKQALVAAGLQLQILAHMLQLFGQGCNLPAVVQPKLEEAGERKDHFLRRFDLL